MINNNMKARLGTMIRKGLKQELLDFIENFSENEKVCPDCRRSYPLDDFKRPGGEYSYCSACREVRSRDYCEDRRQRKRIADERALREKLKQRKEVCHE